MERESLLKLIEMTRPDVIRAEMYADPLIRQMNLVRQEAKDGEHQDLLALYNDETLTKEQIYAGFEKARSRYEATMERLVPLRERFEREVRIPSIIDSGDLKKSAAAKLRRQFGIAPPKRNRA